MNIHEGPTGKAIKEERNHKVNAGQNVRKRKRRLMLFPKLKGCPNPLARRNAFFKMQYGIA